MVSTLKLTKIQIPNSDSDVLSFNSSTGVMTFHKDIKGEGTATTNLQQGLAKAWVLADGDNNNSLTDSFNIASGTDNGTGDYTYAIANDMSNANFAASATGAGGGRRYAIQFGRTTGTFGVKLYDDNELSADNPIASKIHGDLA